MEVNSSLTMEEYKENSILEEVKETLRELDKNLSVEDMSRIIYNIHKLAKISVSPDFNEEYQKKVAELIIDHGKFVPFACDIIVKVINENNFLVDNENSTAEMNFDMIKNCSLLLENYSDYSDLFCQELCKQEEIIKFMAEKLLEWAPDHLQGILPKEKEKLVEAFLTIAHNMVKLPENVNTFRKYGYVTSVDPYLKSQNETYKLLALITLAGILTEEECDLIKTNKDSIKLLLSILDNAIAEHSRRYDGFSAAELGRAVGKLAKNDSNKKLLVQLGALPLLLNLATSDIKIEQEESIGALWMLAFDEENQPKMVAEPNLIKTIEKLQRTTEGNVKKLCNGIFWTLRNILKENVKFKHLVQSFEEKSGKTKYEEKGHVMISYQWDDQDILKQIVSELRKNNIKVWMDIDHMEGSTIEAMANAIEGAKVIISCMSQRYKESPNCRAEAEYAYQLRRPIIPLIMEKDYRPDGWLGFILGAKLYYDFSEMNQFELKIDEVMKAVKKKYDGKVRDEVDGPCIQKETAVKQHSSQHKDEDEGVKKWTSKQVGAWLQKHNLTGYEKLTKLSGKEIIFLKNLKIEAPESFYQTLNRKLGEEEFEAKSDFIDALKDLSLS